MVVELDFDDEPEVLPGETDAGRLEHLLDTCLAAGANGINIPIETYHKLPGISGTRLKLLNESNVHFDNAQLFDPGSTDALVFGNLFHTATIEPHELENRYCEMPKYDLRTNAGKADKAAFIEENKDKEIVDEESLETAKKMARNVRAICGDMINRGIIERSLFVDYRGLILKCRIDIDLEDEGIDCDLKSITLGTRDFSNKTLEYVIKDYKYHWSAALRNIVRRLLGKPARENILVFCNTGPGNMVRVVKIADDWMHEAEQYVMELLNRRLYYLKTGDDVEISSIDDTSYTTKRERI